MTKYRTQIFADPSGTGVGSVVCSVPFAVSAPGAAALAWFRGAGHRRQDEPDLTPVASPTVSHRLDDERSRPD